MLKKVLLMIIIGLLSFSTFSILAPLVMAPETTLFSDNFEAATIDPFWTVTQDYGTVTLSSDQAHSGFQSVKMSSIGGGQRGMTLSHTFQAVGKGIASVWLYDTTPRTNTLYAALDVINTDVPWGTPGFGTWVIVQDWDPDYYHAHDGITDYTTIILRTLGWHEFKIVYNPGNVEMFIDGTLVNSYVGDYGFNLVQLQVFGPEWRPNATFYFDDFFVQWVPIAPPVGVPELNMSLPTITSIATVIYIAIRKRQNKKE